MCYSEFFQSVCLKRNVTYAKKLNTIQYSFVQRMWEKFSIIFARAYFLCGEKNKYLPNSCGVPKNLKYQFENIFFKSSTKSSTRWCRYSIKQVKTQKIITRSDDSHFFVVEPTTTNYFPRL